MKWLQRVRQHNAARRRAFRAAVLLLLLVWGVLTFAGVAAYALVFERVPSEVKIAGWFIFLGTALTWAFTRYGPIEPMPGKSAEEHAADAFFSSRDVKSDDHAFLPGDDPAQRRP